MKDGLFWQSLGSNSDSNPRSILKLSKTVDFDSDFHSSYIDSDSSWTRSWLKPWLQAKVPTPTVPTLTLIWSKLVSISGSTPPKELELPIFVRNWSFNFLPSLCIESRYLSEINCVETHLEFYLQILLAESETDLGGSSQLQFSEGKTDSTPHSDCWYLKFLHGVLRMLWITAVCLERQIEDIDTNRN